MTKRTIKTLFLLGVTVLLSLTSAAAGPRDYLFRNERVCDAERVFCIRGTLTYESNPHLVTLRARVQDAPGPGMLRIRLTGTNNLGHQRRAPFEVRVRGRAVESGAPRDLGDRECLGPALRDDLARRLEQALPIVLVVGSTGRRGSHGHHSL